MKRTMNFNPGPAALPLPVLEQIQREVLDFGGSGMSILEASHRAAEYDKVHVETAALMKELLGVGDDYHVIFLGGGASTQFAMVPLNLLGEGKVGDYLVTGSWSKKALKEGKIVGKANVAATTEVDGKFTRIPKPEECKYTPGAAYVHLTSNNTIFGTQWHAFPVTETPLIGDMSSDLLWRPFDATRFALIYAGAQKNLGPAGVTVVILRDELLRRCKDGLPTMLSYKTHVQENSLYNTPPCFAVYVVNKVLHWVKDGGGLTAMERANRAKGDLLYGTIDKHAGFYRAPVERDSRSYMNVVFRLPTEDLEQKFLAEAKQQQMAGLKGHRSVGGIRVSIYNAVPREWVKAVTDLMEDFVKRNG